MLAISFESYNADPDMSFRSRTKDDGSTCYKYVLLHTDEILYIIDNPNEIMIKETGQKFKFKSSSIGHRNHYLSNKMTQVALDDGNACWIFSSSQCFQNEIKKDELNLAKNNQLLPSRAKYVSKTGYIT